ncbi:MAG: neutral ceramidase [Verrucomicrobiales bacterium]|jgi:neutral ceramidase
MILRTLTTLTFLLAHAVLHAAESDAAPLFAGTAKVEITPSAAEAVDLLGRPLGLRDPLYARVLVLKNEHTSLAIVSLDLIVFASAKVIDEAKTKWGVDHVILSATHTHAAPAPRGLTINPPTAPDWTRGSKAPAELIDWPGLSEDPWYAATEQKVVEAIGQALKDAFPARLVSGKGAFESAYMAHNRRLVRSGIVTAMWANPDRRPTSPIDPTIGVIRVEDMDGKPRALAVQYACHPVALMGTGVVSRDYPGAMVDHIEQELGPECMAMFLQGASGDLDPYDLHNLRGENRFNVSKQSGISLAKGALRISSTLEMQPSAAEATIQVKESLITIPNRAGGGSTEVGLLNVVINRDLALLAIPGEPFIQHQLDLTAQSPIKNSFILGLAYHGKGTPFVVYIPTAQAVKEGGYGASECSFLAPEAGALMIREGVARIATILKLAP